MNGGLQRYQAGTAQAWLYTPRRKGQSSSSSSSSTTGDDLALVFVYPDESDQAPIAEGGSAAKTKNTMHFGGRSYPLKNSTVHLQHGAFKALG